MRRILLIVLLQFSAPIMAGVTLAADEAPADPPWQNPASVAYTRNGDGTAVSTANAVLKYSYIMAMPASGGAMQDRFGLSTFIHRDTTAASPTNDRGIALSFSRAYVPDTRNSEGVFSLGVNAKVSFGKALQEDKDASGKTIYPDRNKDRQILVGTTYYKFPLAGDPISNPRPFISFLTGTVGFYSDHSSGGNGKRTGRVTGSSVASSWNAAPFGIDPEANKIGGFGFVPTIQLAAQLQQDSRASQTRVKDNYKLYSATLALQFAKLDKSNVNGLVPSLNLTRSVGADLLIGRPYQTKTELSLGLSF
jgi:hypothetical protein